MDSRTFDCLTTSIARQRGRRATVRLLAGGLLGGLLAYRALPFAYAAQRLDQDGDGLYDDDESLYYGTDPYTYDSDFDGVGDGEEIYYGTNPLVAEVAVREAPTTYQEPTGANADPNTGAVTTGDVNSGVSAGGVPVDGGPSSVDGSTAGSSVSVSLPTTCRGVGVPCNLDQECCGASVFCCWDGISLRTECTDVAASGWICPM